MKSHHLIVIFLILLVIMSYSMLWVIYQPPVSTQKVDNTFNNFPLTSTTWLESNGTVICNANGNQEYIQMCSDGAGGAFITWKDRRSGTSNDIYAHRVNAAGTPQWSANGTAICTEASEQSFPMICSDGTSGAIIVWDDYRGGKSNIYAQRVNSTGVVQWQTNGVMIATGADCYSELQICSDGAGGTIITWYSPGTPGLRNIYAQRINSSGIIQWPARGVTICNATGTQERPLLCSDGVSGAIFTWQDTRNGNYDIYAQRVNAAGTPLWTLNGTAVRTAANTQSYPQLCSDEAEGAIIAWVDQDKKVYAQRLNKTGQAQWLATGINVGSYNYGTESYANIQMCPDGTHGAILCWQYSPTGAFSFDIYAQRINSNGILKWTPNGIPISNASNTQEYPAICKDGEGNVIIMWQDKRSGSYDIYAQRVDSNGKVLCDANGTAVCTALGNQKTDYSINGRVICSDGMGSAIMAWEDERGTSKDIYMAVDDHAYIHLKKIIYGTPANSFTHGLLRGVDSAYHKVNSTYIAGCQSVEIQYRYEFMGLVPYLIKNLTINFVYADPKVQHQIILDIYNCTSASWHNIDTEGDVIPLVGAQNFQYILESDGLYHFFNQTELLMRVRVLDRQSSPGFAFWLDRLTVQYKTAFHLEIMQQLENGINMPPGVLKLSEGQDFNVSLTVQSLAGTLYTIWANVSLYYLINMGIWTSLSGPPLRGLETIGFTIKASNYSLGDDIYYYFKILQYFDEATPLQELYWTQDGMKSSASQAQAVAFHKRVYPLLYGLSLNYSVWYSTKVRNQIPSESGGNINVSQWGHVSYEDITVNYANTTNSLDNFSVTCPNAALLDHYIDDASRIMTHFGDPFINASAGIQSSFILTLQRLYIPAVTQIKIPLIKYEDLFTNHYLNLTGDFLNLTFIQYENWPYPYRTVLKFISGLNVTMRFDAFTGIMVFYEQIIGSETTADKIVLGLQDNSENYPINLVVEKRAEIIGGGFSIIPDYIISILYDPPGDHSFSQLTVGTTTTYGINFEQSGSTWGETNKTYNKYTIGGASTPGNESMMNAMTSALEGIPFVGVFIRELVQECRKNADIKNTKDAEKVLGTAETSAEYSGMVIEGKGYDIMAEFTNKKTVTSSLDSENPELIGPGRGDLYSGASLIICSLLIRENHYIVINEPDDPVLHVDDIYVWNSNDTTVNTVFDISAQFSVLGAYLESYNLTQISQFNIFIDNNISSNEESSVRRLPESPIFWTPSYLQEFTYSNSTTTTRTLTYNIEYDWSSLEYRHLSSGSLYKEGEIIIGNVKDWDQHLVWTNDTTIGTIGTVSFTSINTSSTTENREIMCHLEDDDGTPIGQHDQFLLEIYQDLRYGTFGFITYENFTYTSDPFEYGTRDRRPPTECQIVDIPEYLQGNITLECGAIDGETGMAEVQFYINEYPILLLDDSRRIGVQTIPMTLNPNIYQLIWNTGGRQGTYYLFAVAYDNADPVHNSRVSSPYMIRIDNVLPTPFQLRAYSPFRDAIDFYANAFDGDSGIAFVEYWDGLPGEPNSTYLGRGTDTSSSYNFKWATDPAGTDDGVHFIYARAYDEAGNYRDSLQIEIQVDNGSGTIEGTGWLEIALIVMGSLIAIGLIALGILLRSRPGMRPPKKPQDLSLKTPQGSLILPTKNTGSSEKKKPPS